MCRRMIELVEDDPRSWHTEWRFLMRDYDMCPTCDYTGWHHEIGCETAVMCLVASGLGHLAGEWPADWKAHDMEVA